MNIYAFFLLIATAPIDSKNVKSRRSRDSYIFKSLRLIFFKHFIQIITDLGVESGHNIEMFQNSCLPFLCGCFKILLIILFFRDKKIDCNTLPHDVQKRAVELLTADCEKELAAKQAEVDKLEQELKRTMDALRESEALRDRQMRSSQLRESEQAKTVQRLQEMIDSMTKSNVVQQTPVQQTGRAAYRQETPVQQTGRTAYRQESPAQQQTPQSEPLLQEEPADGFFDAAPGRTLRRGFGTQTQNKEQAGTAARYVDDAPNVSENMEPAKSTVMDDLVQMAASDDNVLKEELFSIDECLGNVMVLQKPVCDKKRIRLELKKSVSMPDKAIGDKAKLQRALVSLLESATEQTPEGGVINLGCRADRASGNRVYLYFTIRDNGSSIASELMQGMFEMKDERDDPLRAGLYTAREIVSIMGGNVRVRSRRGEGTEFMVTVCMNMP